MKDLEIPKIIEFIKRETLDKGRVKTTLRMFMIDSDLMEELVAHYARGQISTVECREGVTIKHPKDKYDKKIAKEEATKKLKKKRYKITSVLIVGEKIRMSLATEEDYLLEIVKDKHGVRIYGS